MAFRTYYTVNTNQGQIENVESFEKQGAFLRIKHYPNVNAITNEVIRIKPEVMQIPMGRVENIKEREVRF